MPQHQPQRAFIYHCGVANRVVISVATVKLMFDSCFFFHFFFHRYAIYAVKAQFLPEAQYDIYGAYGAGIRGYGYGYVVCACIMYICTYGYVMYICEVEIC